MLATTTQASALETVASKCAANAVFRFNCQTAAHKTSVIVPEISDGGRVVFCLPPSDNIRGSGAPRGAPSLVSAHWRGAACVRRDAHAPRRSTAATFHPGAVLPAADGKWSQP